MSDTENKKSSKGSENSSSSKKHAAAAAAAINGQDGTKVVDETLASPVVSLQSRKRVKHGKTERKTNKLPSSASPAGLLDIVKMEMDEDHGAGEDNTPLDSSTAVVSPVALNAVSALRQS